MANSIEREPRGSSFKISVDKKSLEILLYGRDNLSTRYKLIPFKSMEERVLFPKSSLIKEIYVMMENGFARGGVLKGITNVGIYLVKGEGEREDIRNQIESVTGFLRKSGFSAVISRREEKNKMDCDSILIEDQRTSVDFWDDFLLISHEPPVLIKGVESKRKSLEILEKDIENLSELTKHVLNALSDVYGTPIPDVNINLFLTR